MASQNLNVNASLASSQFAHGVVVGKNPLWSYVTLTSSKKVGNGNASWICNYCNITYNGSYSRVKAHLLRIPKQGICICWKVSDECLEEMKQIEMEAVEKAKPVQVPFSTGTTSSRPPLDNVSKKRRGGALEKAWNNEARDHLTCEIARFFYSAGLPFNTARNPYFVNMLTYAAKNNISGFVPHGYNAIRTTLLQKEKANIIKLLQPIKDIWLEKGVSIVTDGWTDANRRPLINFMAVCDSGPMFLKAIDRSGEYKDKYYMASQILDTIHEVGAQDVVQVITDNAPVCKATSFIVESEISHIFWTPCVVHTLNLALKSICAPKNTDANQVAYNECSWIFEIAVTARLIKNFIVNHSMRLAMFNRFVHLRLLAVAQVFFNSHHA